MLEAGGLVIHPEQRTVFLYGEPVELTPKEVDILVLLASHPKKVFSSEHIFEKVWGEAYYEGGNTVMVHIRTLRKKLGEDQHKNKLIKTVWGVGYTFNG
ncbi:Phosphate regulon transcriptional regulatory protein PhoB [compost metagenome]